MVSARISKDIEIPNIVGKLFDVTARYCCDVMSLPFCVNITATHKAYYKITSIKCIEDGF